MDNTKSTVTASGNNIIELNGHIIKYVKSFEYMLNYYCKLDEELVDVMGEQENVFCSTFLGTKEIAMEVNIQVVRKVVGRQSYMDVKCVHNT